MPIEITMPRLSDTMEEGTLVKWRVKPGDEVASGDHLADVETDKATMELQAFDDGKVAALAVEEGQTVPVGSLILVLAEEGESLEEAAKSAQGASAGQDSAASSAATQSAEAEGGGTAVAAPPATATTTAAPAPGGDDKRVRVSPVARKIAEEHGLDLSQIKGSGPDGRIIKRDVLALIEGGTSPASPAPSVPTSQPAAPAQPAAVQASPVGLEAKTINLSGMRKTIARRLVESKTTVPHFQVTVSINMDPLLDLRKTLNTQLEAQGVKLSVNDFIVRATALACLSHPEANSSWNGDTIIQHGTVNVGVAVSLPAERGGGLVVPVIRDAQNKGLRQISTETKQLAKKARETGLSPEEMADGTITLSNLGMYGVDQFTAIINPPQAAIIAVGAANEKPVVRDGQIVVGHEMNATLSGDHRVIDGAQGAEYLSTFKQLLENPASLLV
ncbi:MAG: pyruvate dehydrogenase complex dihydrolipoamide acetyltransferase [Phycisphaeraceae bacterium]